MRDENRKQVSGEVGGGGVGTTVVTTDGSRAGSKNCGKTYERTRTASLGGTNFMLAYVGNRSRLVPLPSATRPPPLGTRSASNAPYVNTGKAARQRAWPYSVQNMKLLMKCRVELYSTFTTFKEEHPSSYYCYYQNYTCPNLPPSLVVPDRAPRKSTKGKEGRAYRLRRVKHGRALGNRDFLRHSVQLQLKTHGKQMTQEYGG